MNLFCSARGFHYLCKRITENNRQKNGMLYIIPTPVGNLEDMTLRAVRLLKEADVVLAEDTRTSGILLKHFDIQNHLLSHHKLEALSSQEDVLELIIEQDIDEAKDSLIIYEIIVERLLLSLRQQELPPSMQKA